MHRLLVLLLMVLASSVAHAHAMLDHANPPVGGTVSAAPRQVSLTFTQNLEGSFSSIEVTDGAGTRVDTGKAQVSGNTMRVGLRGLRPGSYHVRWHALSVDTHKTEGSFTFHVGQ
jgi:copper resistance protein C